MSACPVRASVALGAILLPLQFILTPTPEPPPVSVSTGLPWTSLWLPDGRRSHQDSPPAICTTNSFSTDTSDNFRKANLRPLKN